MKELIEKLHAGGYSCVIANGDCIRTFTQRGVADLYRLLREEAADDAERLRRLDELLAPFRSPVAFDGWEQTLREARAALNTL